MICYKDKTWCYFYEDCKNKELCGRAYTEDIKEAVKAWGKSIGCTAEETPVCFYTDIPSCFEMI